MWSLFVWFWQDQGLICTSGRGDYVCLCLCYARKCPSAALRIKTVGERIALPYPLYGVRSSGGRSLWVRAQSVSLLPRFPPIRGMRRLPCGGSN